MMMKALESGGLTAAHNTIRNEMNTEFGDEHYQPNEGGFYELHKSQYRDDNFPYAYEGMLIKLLMGGITSIGAGNYNIVFMVRDFEEITQSHNAFFDHPPKMNADRYEFMKNKNIGILEQRRDINLTVLNYRDVVDDPTREFTKLKNAGWEIDVEKCTGIVDVSKCRFRLEDLQVGVV